MTLYERILGEKFKELSPLVQTMHSYDSSKTLKGTVNIQRGKSFVAKLLNPLMGLPKEQKDALLMLELKAEKQEEIWKRTFGIDSFSSVQYQDAEQMVEHMGLIKMYFDVYVDEASLCTVLKTTTILGVNVPKIFTLNISSQVKEEQGIVLFSVEVSTKKGALVINYDGIINL